jgi:large repetitive protein
MLVKKIVRGVLCLVILLGISTINAGPTEGEAIITEEDTPVSITLIGNDPDGDKLTYNVVTDPSHGSLGGTAPKLTYTPEQDFNGTDSFTFTINDGTADSVPTTVIIVVTAVNDSPKANDTRVTTQEDTNVSITLTGCDPDGDTLVYSIVKGPSKGKLTGTGPNLSYTPNENFNGTDSFTFKVNDGKIDSDEATVEIKLLPVNDPPKASYAGTIFRQSPLEVKVKDVKTKAVNNAPNAKDDKINTREGVPVSVIDVLTNDIDKDGDSLSITAVTQGKNGKVAVNTDNTLSYTPNQDFNGSDSFTYTVCDDKGGSNKATVNVKIEAVNDPPMAYNGNVTTLEDDAVSVTLTGGDDDGDKITYHVVTVPSHGELKGRAPRLIYAPNPNFNGSDKLTFKTSDGKVESDIATISVTVKPVNDAPIANNSSVITKEGKSVSVSLTGTDPDGDLLTYIVVTGPSHGSLKGMAGASPKVSYTPAENFSGTDSFTFKVSDKTAESAVATALITIEAVNSSPTAEDDNAETKEDTKISSIDVLKNDTDVDNDRLKVTSVTQGKNGSVSINKDNTLSYNPNENFYGADAFTYTISDGNGGTDTAAVKIKVEAVNDKPKFISKPVTKATVGEEYLYDVDAADPDILDTLVYSLTIKPMGMTIDKSTGLIKWTPNETQPGMNDVAVRVEDGGKNPASDTQPFTIKVALPDKPAEPAKPATPAEITLNDTAIGSAGAGRKILSIADKNIVVQASDNDRWETSSGLYTSYDFSDVYIPQGAKISSVVVYVEHFEQEEFPEGKLQWTAGTGWPDNPMIWASLNAPVYAGEPNESIDLWDVTSFVNTPEKVNSLQLQIKNNDDVAKSKTSIDYIYAVVEWN